MVTNLFDQFESAQLLGVPLIVPALALPWILYPRPDTRWINNRLLTLQHWLWDRVTHHMFSSISLGGHKWATVLTPLMLFLITLNLLGLLPYTFTPTTQLSMNMAFAMPLWLATVILGFTNNPNKALAHLLPEGTPTLLIPVLIIIETISLLMRPFALAVRLTANLTAGHLLIQLTATATFVLSSTLPALSMITGILLLMLTLLEVAVAMIQAYVFVLLLSLYLQENV